LALLLEDFLLRYFLMHPDKSKTMLKDDFDAAYSARVSQFLNSYSYRLWRKKLELSSSNVITLIGR
jgi:hypothetical protein